MSLATSTTRFVATTAFHFHGAHLIRLKIGIAMVVPICNARLNEFFIFSTWDLEFRLKYTPDHFQSLICFDSLENKYIIQIYVSVFSFLNNLYFVHLLYDIDMELLPQSQDHLLLTVLLFEDFL